MASAEFRRRRHTESKAARQRKALRQERRAAEQLDPTTGACSLEELAIAFLVLVFGLVLGHHYWATSQVLL